MDIAFLSADAVEPGPKNKQRTEYSRNSTAKEHRLTKEWLAKQKARTAAAYFFTTIRTRAVAAWFLSIPPMMTNPTGVFRIPPLSERTSTVSSVIVSQRLPCGW